MESWQRAGFGNRHIFRVARTENATAFLDAAHASLREAGCHKAANAVGIALLLAQKAAGRAKQQAKDAGYPLNEGWPRGGERIL